MSVEQPWEDGGVAGSRTHMGSFLSMTGLSSKQRQCLIDLSSQFHGVNHAPKPIARPPYDYYIRGSTDLQLVHDAIVWYTSALTDQYETNNIRMVGGILLEALTRLNEISAQLGICLDVVRDQEDGE